ncbi:hypothetical protein [Pedosphaera parvula]|uniref:Uncharacterized protein n=1 Tax=Pedosphaera parvula (strain Ellin514) TaxID=320771 RepID=B9XQR5_PEDPL|nr:hypothetical protein [Pedosphaera parvula]EEF57847.1 hypothetical protein Cflav_PD0829 [Pedosphaera parvula Ellin514]
MADQEISKPSKWKLGDITLEMDGGGEVRGLKQQNPELNLLYTLARAKIDGLAQCALDLIFCWGHKTFDTEDALAAYSENPLENPPERYLSLFKEVDWTCNGPPHALRVILLAGSKGESDKQLLLQILNTLSEDFRDAAVYAASSFRDREFVEAVSRIAMSVTEQSAMATGEMRAFVICFKRWMEREVVSLEDIERMLISFEQPGSDLMSARRLINHIVCLGWNRVPYTQG